MRPSLASQREAEILVAVEACILEHGIGGLTVQQIADKSGYSRGHVRHYLGNKADQLNALVRVYNDRYATSLEQTIQDTPTGQRRSAVLTELFGDVWMESRPQDDIVLDHLTAYASSHPDSGVSLKPMYDRITDAVMLALADVLPDEQARERARVVVSLAYGTSSMARMGVVSPADVQSYAKRLLLLEEA